VERYGLQGSIITAVDLLKGIGILSGLKYIQVDGATGFIDTNYAGKAKAALKALEKDNIVFLHVEAPDEAGHMGDIEIKKQAIEDFDSKIVGWLFDRVKNCTVLVLPDHATPVLKRTHTNSPVPFAVWPASAQRKNKCKAYCEKEAKKGPLIIDGATLLQRTLNNLWD